MEVTLEFIWENYAIAKEMNRAGMPDAAIKKPFISRIAFRIANLVRVMRPHHEEISKRRDALVEKYGKPNEKGVKSIEAGTQAFIDADKEFNEMLKAENVTLDVKPVEIPEDMELPGFVFNLDPLVTTKE